MSSASLLRDAAQALDGGESPFSTGWLGEHDVTLDQCMALSHQLALGARIVAKAIEKPKSKQGIAMLELMAEELT